MPTLALPSSHHLAVHRLLLVCGIAASVVYVAADVIGALVWSDYSPVDQTISELSAIDAPSRPIWLSLGIAYDLLLVAFGAAVWERGGKLRVTAGLLIAIAVIGTFWPPMHLRGTEVTATDTLHVVFAGVESLLILLAIGFGARALGRGFRWYSIATIAVSLVAGTLTSRMGFAVAANLPTPSIGIYERIALGAYLAWVCVLAVALLRRSDEPLAA